ncbi:MAG: hypothetical protein JWP87_3871 [Labilithrix sp.]|jgi:hypothetical protein|nr:hypothetical protein [Labilithrix sp.]
MDVLGNRLGLGLGLALSLVVVACAAPTIPNDVGDSADSADSNVTGSKKTPKKTKNDPEASPEGDPAPESTPAPDPTPAPAPTPTNCNQTAADACFDCCNQASGGTYAKADEAFGQCACGGGQCTAVCENDLCTGAPPSAACQQCLTQTCEPAANALCTSAACKTGQACVKQCPQ